MRSELRSRRAYRAHFVEQISSLLTSARQQPSLCNFHAQTFKNAENRIEALARGQVEITATNPFAALAELPKVIAAVIDRNAMIKNMPRRRAEIHVLAFTIHIVAKRVFKRVPQRH